MRAAGQQVDVLGMQDWRKLVTPLALARRLRRLRPDVVHVHLLSGQLFGIPAARLAGVPVVVSSEHSLMDDTIEGRPLSRRLRLIYRLLERLATRTVAVSATTADRLVRWGVDRRRIAVSDNGIDFETLRFDEMARGQVRRDLGLDHDTPVIGVVGRLEGVKRIDVALRASLPRLREGAHLIVAGSGSLRPDLESLGHERGVADRVHWLGGRSDMAAVLSACDVLVSACADETFGMAVVEGLAAGLPAVYVQCPALEELPERPAHAHQVGTSPDPEDAARLLREGIDGVLSDPANGSRRHPVPASLTDRYGAEAAALRNDALYRSLQRERSG